MSRVALSEQSLAWDLRSSWGLRREVRLTLTDRCMIGTIVGRVSAVSVTGAFATVDGWHIPLADVLAIGKPTLKDHERYQRAMRKLRDETAIEAAVGADR